MRRPEIVIGFDESDAAATALAWAATEAVRLNATVRAVHVLGWPFGAVFPGETAPPTAYDDVDAAYRAGITARFDRIRPRPDWILQFARGDAGPVLVRQSSKALFLVIGSPEHGYLGRLIVGSVAHYCLSHATRPVICVPPHQVAAAELSSSQSLGLPMAVRT